MKSITARHIIEASKILRAQCNGTGPQLTFHFCEGSNADEFFGHHLDLQSPKAAIECLNRFVRVLNKVASTNPANKGRNLQ